MLVHELIKQRNLSEITGIFCLFHAAVSFFAAILLGPSALVTLPAVALIIVLDLTIWLSLSLANKRSAPLLLASAWFMLLFFLPRLTTFQIFPAPTIRFVALDPFSRPEITTGLLYLVSGYMALWAGISTGSRFFTQSAYEPRPKWQLPLAGLAIFTAMAFASSIYIYFVIDVSIYAADSSRWGSRSGWITRIFDTDAALLFVLTWLMLNRHAPRSQLILAIAIVVVWLFLSLSLGSRGGPLRIMILVGLSAFAIYGNPVSSISRVLVIVVAGFLASAVMYPIGTIVRYYTTSGDDAAANLIEDWLRSGDLVERSDAWPLRQIWSRSEVINQITRVASPVSTRLGLVDYPIMIVNRSPNQEIIDHYLTINYSLKNFVNNMVPGELYPDYDVMTSRIFTMAYRDADESQIRSAFLSEPWTLWGFSWLKGGTFGGLLIIFGLTAFIQVGYRAIPQVVGPTLSPYIGTAYLFVPVTGGLLQLFGLDHWLTISAHFAMAMLTSLAVTYGFGLIRLRVLG